ncbi:DoxX family protein [Mycolicibacterium sp.]|uniref:DoxX family protein n=1 Tax=Mycolicibacterium sp. TaxID=2320850 RepID=UPI001D4AAD98|nr:DoxX family protein [Mycolicibacterium sp.]MCB1290104.1 DoxX family protein [Mycobacterium sp.]MCB9408571.1 DoxX family protein [Mycolicibacterium sp.]
MTSQNPDPGWQRPDEPAVRPATARLVDPEDDLGSTNYGGEFETTKIGPPPGTPAPPTAYGLLHDPEPLPYVQPPAQPSGHIPDAPHHMAAPTEITPVEADERVKAAGRRGTQDLGLLLLRVTLGVVFIAHGLQNAFGWLGGPGPDGFRDSLTEAGYRYADLLSYVVAGTQIASGVLLVLGLFTPVAAAVALAFLVNSLLATFTAQREEGGLFVFGSEAEYMLVLSVAAAAVILAGPGRYGFDGGRGWARRPFIGSFLALLLGIGGGVAAWLFLRGHNPFG